MITDGETDFLVGVFEIPLIDLISVAGKSLCFSCLGPLARVEGIYVRV